MMKTACDFGIRLKLPYDEAVGRVKDALKTEGFGVLTEIDVRMTMREKLGVERDHSNPEANRLLDLEWSAPLLPPVRQEGCPFSLKYSVRPPFGMVSHRGVDTCKPMDA